MIMKKTDSTKDLFTDPLDREIAGLFTPLRETVVPDDGFSSRVMATIPRRDVSLWVVWIASLAGIGAAVAITGTDKLMMLYRFLEDFFLSVGAMEVPSGMSLAVFVSVLAVIGFIFYALLDTDDYQTAGGNRYGA